MHSVDDCITKKNEQCVNVKRRGKYDEQRIKVNGRGDQRGEEDGDRGNKGDCGNNDQEIKPPHCGKTNYVAANCYREIAELKAEKEARDVDKNKKRRALANHHARLQDQDSDGATFIAVFIHHVTEDSNNGQAIKCVQSQMLKAYSFGELPANSQSAQNPGIISSVSYNNSSANYGDSSENSECGTNSSATFDDSSANSDPGIISTANYYITAGPIQAETTFTQVLGYGPTNLKISLVIGQSVILLSQRSNR
jgi:hypothetical protein